MREAEKTNLIRGQEFFSKFCVGKVIDIGAGDSPVVSHAEVFDVQHGDANQILKYRSESSYDCVHSSHCLEHMLEPKLALDQWIRLAKVGGFIITVVPDEDLYEQGNWPSLFNADHKWSFRLDGDSTTEKSISLSTWIKNFHNVEVLSIERQSANYNQTLRCRAPTVIHRALAVLTSHIRWRLWKLNLTDSFLDKVICRLAPCLSIPVDQTLGKAVAQIQIIMRRSS